MYALLGETFEERTTGEWLDLFRSLDIPAAPLRTPDELFENSHLTAADASVMLRDFPSGGII